MPSFGRKSQSRLARVHPKLTRIMEELVKDYDITIIYGARTVEEQRQLVAEGLSKTMDSKHIPREDGYAYAVDVAPYPIDWEYKEPYYYMWGRIEEIAKRRGVKLRWGGDWDMDKDFNDQTFMDLVHVELLDD